MSNKLAAFREVAALPELPDAPLKGNGKLPAWHWHLTPLGSLTSGQFEWFLRIWQGDPVRFTYMVVSEIENRRGVPPK